MERPAGHYFKDRDLFFILGAGDQMIHNLKETAVRVTMRTGNDLGYLLNIPVRDLLEVVEMIIKADQEAKEARKKY